MILQVSHTVGFRLTIINDSYRY